MYQPCVVFNPQSSWCKPWKIGKQTIYDEVKQNNFVSPVGIINNPTGFCFGSILYYFDQSRNFNSGNSRVKHLCYCFCGHNSYILYSLFCNIKKLNMKNGLKILTLAGFVLGGLMLYSAVFASFVQNDSNGWIVQKCNGGNSIYFSSSPTCETGTQYSNSLDGGEVYFNATGTPLLGTFTGINSVTLEINNNFGTSTHSTMQIQAYDNAMTSLCYVSSGDTVIPIGTNNITYTITGCTGVNNTNLTGGLIRFIVAPTSGGDRSNLAFAAKNSCVNSGVVVGYGGICPPTTKIAINTSFLPPIGLTNPTNLQQVAANNALPITGVCGHVGINKLAITTVSRFSVMMSSGDYSSLVYNIECKSDYTFSTTYPETVEGQTGLVIIDKTDGGNTSVLFTVVSPNYKNALWLNYPPVNHDNVYNIKSGVDVLQFGYLMPASAATTSITGLMLFSLAQCSDNTYNICTALTNPEQTAISSLDTTQSGFFEVNATSTQATSTYYQAILVLSSGYQATSSQFTIGTINFDLYGDDSSIYTNSPTGSNLNTNAFLQMLQNKFLFAYAMQIYNIFSGLANENNNASLTPIALTMYLPNGSTVTPTSTLNGGAALTGVSLPIISQEEIFKILPKPTWDLIKELEGAGMIIGTAWLIWGRIKSYRHKA